MPPKMADRIESIEDRMDRVEEKVEEVRQEVRQGFEAMKQLLLAEMMRVMGKETGEDRKINQKRVLGVRKEIR